MTQELEDSKRAYEHVKLKCAETKSEYEAAQKAYDEATKNLEHISAKYKFSLELRAKLSEEYTELLFSSQK